MALRIVITRIEIPAIPPAGPVPVVVHTKIDDDAAGHQAMGVEKGDTRNCVLPRAAFNALVTALRRPNTDTFNDAVIPHPITKDPP